MNTVKPQDKNGVNDDDLTPFFAAAQQEAPQISPAFLDNLGQQARNVQPAPVRNNSARHPHPFWGAWSFATGLMASAVLGIWVGINPPDYLLNVTSPVLAEETFDDLLVLSNYDFAPSEDL